MKRTQLLPNRLQLIQIRLILRLVLHLLLNPLKDPHRRRVVVHPPSCAERGLADRGGRDEIMSEAVVQTALDLEQVLGIVEEIDVALGERLERLLLVRGVPAGLSLGEDERGALHDDGANDGGAEEGTEGLSSAHRGEVTMVDDGDGKGAGRGGCEVYCGRSSLWTGSDFSTTGISGTMLPAGARRPWRPRPRLATPGPSTD